MRRREATWLRSLPVAVTSVGLFTAALMCGMHWIGGLWATDSVASAAFRAFNLLKDFEGIIYVPRVTAEEPPADRPRVAPRHS